MINNILVYVVITIVSWIIFMLLIYGFMEVIDYTIEQWRYDGD